MFHRDLSLDHLFSDFISLLPFSEVNVLKRHPGMKIELPLKNYILPTISYPQTYRKNMVRCFQMFSSNQSLNSHRNARWKLQFGWSASPQSEPTSAGCWMKPPEGLGGPTGCPAEYAAEIRKLNRNQYYSFSLLKTAYLTRREPLKIFCQLKHTI